ncbi:MAG: folylpolyglutamate synthase/dihydrofolate synthase family protein [Gemmatimonadota bacterium]
MKAPPDSAFSAKGGELQGGGDIDLGRIFPPLPTGVQWGLERTETLLSELGNPQNAYPTLHVGGTNGKGSLAAVWARILKEEGRRTGLYTSPHLCSFRERFQIDGKPVPAQPLLEAADELREGIGRLGLTFFEAATVLAFHLFAKWEVEVGLVEVGLGGRLDSTNVIIPQLTAITNVALDHAEYLGFTLEEIAGEKAGIIKAGVPVITAERDGALREIFRARAEELGAPFHAMNPVEEVENLVVSSQGNVFELETGTWGRLELRSPLPGRHQAANVALAIRSLELLQEPLRPGAEAVVAGVSKVRWPGRLQIHQGPRGLWVFDVAHNVAGVRALAASLRRLSLPEPIILLVGIQGDKDWRSMLPPLFAMAREAVLTQPPTVPPERRWDPLEAAGAVKARPNLHILPDFAEALEMARNVAGQGTVVVTGSHHTVGDGMNALGILPYES